MSKPTSSYNSNRNNLHNSQLYQKLLDEEHFVSQHSQHESPYAQQQQQGEGDRVEMVIEFGEANNASIMVGAYDDPVTLAKLFCFKHNIDPRIITTLAVNIKNLQRETFPSNKFKESSFRIDRNQPLFDDKQNKNMINYQSRENKSGEKTLDSTKIRRSRNKTVQSSFNDTQVPSNSKSAAITGGSTSNRYNVFERLYRDSRKKTTFRPGENANASKRSESKMSLSNSTVNNKSLNESSINSCLYIYQKNTKLRQQAKKHNQHLLQLKQQKQVQSCKFKPNINPLSNLIATKLRELDQSSIMNRSSNDKQMLKIKEYLLKRQQEEMKECTFKPKIINKISSHNSKYSTERYLQLHDDYQFRQARKKQISQERHKQSERQHHPSINKVSNIIVNKDFYQRLQEDKTKRLVRRQSMEKIKRQESKEGKPATGRPPANRNLGEKTIGEYLYEKAKQSKALPIKYQPKIVVDPKSSLIYSQSKKCAFQFLFYLLDSDQDGLISSTRINIGGLGEEILRLMAPLLSEMEEVEVELNQQEFFEAFERLYSTFSVDEKNLILKFCRNKGTHPKPSDQPTFHPALNQKSLMIARELCGDQGDIYQSSVMRLKEKESKLNRLRAERMLDEYNQCTFHPKLRY